METLQLFRLWFADFECCVADDQWQRLEPYLQADVEYHISHVPFGGAVIGRDAVLAGFKKSFDGFDRRMASRSHLCVATEVVDVTTLRFRTWTHYTHAEAPDLAFPARAEFVLREGRIARMEDIYEPATAEMQAAFAWFGEHAARLQLDPSYA